MSSREPIPLTRREVLATVGLAFSVQALAWIRFARSPPPDATRRLERVQVDLNSGSLAELEALPGVGPATARALIASRPIRSEGALLRLLGPKRFRRVHPCIRPLGG